MHFGPLRALTAADNWELDPAMVQLRRNFVPFKTERVTEKDPPTPCLRRCADAGVGMPILRDGSFNKKPQVHIISSNGEAAKLTRMIRLAIAYARTRSPN